MLLGTRLTSYADPLLGAFSFLQAVEVSLHILSMGTSEFFFGKRLKRASESKLGAQLNAAGRRVSQNKTHIMTTGRAPGDIVEQAWGDEDEDEEADIDAKSNFQVSANRFDFLVIMSAILVIFGTSFVGVQQATDQLRVEEERYTFAVNVGMRVAVTLPVLRLFSVIHVIRRLVFALVKRGSTFVPISVLIFLTLYTFAIFGVWLFGGQFRRLSEDVYDLDEAHFDTFSTAMLTLFLVMEGEEWHDVSYAAVDARNSLVPLVYFVLFVVINGLLFTNLFIGVLCDTFSEVEERELAKARKDQEKKDYGASTMILDE